MGRPSDHERRPRAATDVVGPTGGAQDGYAAPGAWTGDDDTGAATAHAAPLPPRIDGTEAPDATGAERLFERLMSIQRPLVVRQIRALRRRHPDDSPERLLQRIEQQYLNTITATGGGAGAAAVVPGIGTAASLAVTGAETAGFLEMSALFGQAVAEIHGLPVSDPVRARILVQSLILGEAAKNVVTQFAGQVSGTGAGRQQFWGEIVTKNLPSAFVGELSKRIQRAFIRKYAARTSAGAVGRLLPFGVGAVVGGAGNRLLGGQIVRAAREAFGPPPASFPLDLNPDAIVRGEEPESTVRDGRFFLLPRGRAARAIERGESGGSRKDRRAAKRAAKRGDHDAA